MLKTFQYPRFAYRSAPELQLAGRTGHHPVVVVGAGPVGLAAAIDLAQHGVPVVLLDDDNTVSIGSRGLCYAKRTLEILDRLGCGQAVVDKGVTWNVGRTFFRNEEVFRFNLQPEADHQRPGMVNLQQYYLEDILVFCLHLDIRCTSCWPWKKTCCSSHSDKPIWCTRSDKATCNRYFARTTTSTGMGPTPT